MMKRFIASMLGSLAAIWISVILLFILGIMMIAAAVSGSVEANSIMPGFKDKTVLSIDLTGSVTERATQPDLMAQMYGVQEVTIPLNDIIGALAAAADDKKIEGVLLNCQGVSAGLAQHMEIIEALKKFKESGKWVVAYADGYTQGDYYIASLADEIYLNPIGAVDIHGLSATTLFFKGLLDKLGVEMQVIKVGTYKSAVEPFILDKASEASKLQQRHYLGNIWNDVAGAIAEARSTTVEQVNEWADSLILTADPSFYVDENLVDKLMYHHDFEQHLKELCGIDEDDDLRVIDPVTYCKIADVPHRKRNDNRIAVLYAVGDIVDNGTEGIVATQMVPMIDKLIENDDIDGLVLRVNSGGGSAFASEQIWEALERFKETGRPFYVSMSDMAASGGYYISSGADRIYAEPVTLTGSIGIFGMIPCISEFMSDKLGVTTDNVSTNLNGDFPTLMSPMTPMQRAMMQKEIDRGYETFVGRCAAGRHMSVDSIKAIAEGRVWDGRSALEIGLVDQLGSLTTAIEDMASELGFEKYCVIEYPNPNPTFWEALTDAQIRAQDNVIKERLGSAYEIYRNIDAVRDMAPVQCRMETVVIE